MSAAGTMYRFLYYRFGGFPTSLFKSPILSSIGSIVKGTITKPRSNTIGQNSIRFLFSLARPTLATVQFHSSLSTRRQFNHSSADAVAPDSWNPRFRVPTMWDDGIEFCPCQLGEIPRCTCNGNHRLITFFTNGDEFQTEQELFDFYIKTLATVVGSEEDAKKRIYLVSCGWIYGFGCEIDKKILPKLSSLECIAYTCPDFKYHKRNQDDDSCQSTVKFTPMNPNRRLDNIYKYYWWSKKKKSETEGTNHWLVHIKQPHGEFVDHDLTLNSIIKLLAKAVGSEVAARKKIYIIWYQVPFGFAAELNKDEVEKLRGISDVLKILPDYAFDLKDNGRYGRGAAHIYPPFHASQLIRECVPDPSDYDLRSDLKHCFIKMKMPIGDASMQQNIDFCIQTLAKVLQSKREQAKNRIYRIECENDCISFGAMIDAETLTKLKGESVVADVFLDNLFEYCPKDVFFVKAWREMTMNLKGWALEPESS